MYLFICLWSHTCLHTLTERKQVCVRFRVRAGFAKARATASQPGDRVGTQQAEGGRLSQSVPDA